MITRRSLIASAAAAGLVGCGEELDRTPTGARLGVVPSEASLYAAMLVIKGLTSAGYADAALRTTDAPERRRQFVQLARTEARHVSELQVQMRRIGLAPPLPPARIPKLIELSALERHAIAGWSWIAPRVVGKELRAAAAIMMPVDVQQLVLLANLTGADAGRDLPRAASPLAVAERLQR